MINYLIPTINLYSFTVAVVVILSIIAILIMFLFRNVAMVRHSLFPILFKLKGMAKLMEILEIMLYFDREAQIFVFRKYILFGPRIFIIGDGKLAHYILKNTNDIKYERNKWISSVKLHESPIGSGSGLNHKIQREIFKHDMFSYNKTKFNVKCNSIISNYLIKWKTDRVFQKNGFSLLQQLISMIIEIHCQCLFGFSIKQLIGDHDNNQYFKTVDHFVDEIMDHIQVISEFFNPKTKTEFADKYFIPSILNQISNDNDGFMSKLCQKLLTQNMLSKNEIIGFYSNILFALTPGFALFWTLMMYNNCSEHKKQKCKNNPLYLKAFLTETMRLYAPINTLLARKSLINDSFNGINIPKDSIIIIPLGFVQNLECNHKNANQFNPERWLENDNKLKLTLPDGLTANFLPFGGGSNHCLGRKIAMNEMMMFLNKFINEYDFNLNIVNNDEFNLFHQNISHWQRFKVLSYSWPKIDCKVKII